MYRLLILPACCLGFALVVGCSSEGPKIPEVAAVTGEVLYQGKPVDGAEVVFTSSAPNSKAARGKTGADGKFALKTYIDAQHDLDGALPGDYQVTVSKQELLVMTADDMAKMGGKAMPPPKDLLPTKYSDANQSGLNAPVKAKEKNVFKFELTD